VASWRFVLTDSSYQPLGEILNASERKVALPLNKLPTSSFKVRMDNPLADPLMSTACYIKGYRVPYGGVPSLQFYGPIISAEEVGDHDNATIAVNAVSVGWFLQKRLAGQSSTGTIYPSTDRAQIIKNLIDFTNSVQPPLTNDLQGGFGYWLNVYAASQTLTSLAQGVDTGIATTSANMSAASAAPYTAGPYKPVLECLTDLSASFDGFDWRIVPIDNFSAGQVTGPKIGSFEALPVFGSQQNNVVYEWGTGRNNVVSYKRTMSRDSQANHVFHIGQAGPDAPGFPVVSAIDSKAVSDWHLLEDLAQADLLDQTLRQKLVTEHVKVRRSPRQLIEFTPHIDPYDAGRLPLFGTEFFVGDTVRARAVFRAVTRFDVLARVWGIAFDINDLGVEQQTITLAQE
jgi:hypothetical protein